MDETRFGVLRADIPCVDVGIGSEPAPGEQRIDSIHHALVTAIVRREGERVIRTRRSSSVGMYVSSTEGVDGLLRVADQDQSAVGVEDSFKYGPLCFVGVLELVNQHYGVLLSQETGGLSGGR